MRTLLASLLAALVIPSLAASARAEDPPLSAKAPEVPPPLAEPPVRIWVMAPTATSLWTLRIDNEGPKPIRVPADIRLLRFEIEPEAFVVPAEVDPTAAKKPAKAVKAPKPTVCKVPDALRPEGYPDRSALLLAPGESYIESFDPRLFCFGKEAGAALTGSAVVHPRFGWEAPKKPAYAAKKKTADTGPFVVEGTSFPADVLPIRELVAPTLVLPYDRPPPPPLVMLPVPDTRAADVKPPDPRPADPRPDAGAKSGDPGKRHPSKTDAPPAPPRPQIIDENAPRLELSADPYVEASTTSRASLTLTAVNAGHRPMQVAIHPRMLGFRVEGPDGTVRCEPLPPTHGIPRELYRTLKPGGMISMTLLLAESCGRDTFRRPGLYKITPSIHANESGAEVGIAAYTGAAVVKAPSLVRVQSGPDPFYAVPPHAVPTPKPKPMSPDGEGDDETPKSP